MALLSPKVFNLHIHITMHEMVEVNEADLDESDDDFETFFDTMTARQGALFSDTLRCLGNLQTLAFSLAHELNEILGYDPPSWCSSSLQTLNLGDVELSVLSSLAESHLSALRHIRIGTLMGLADENALEKASRVAERLCPTVQIEVQRFVSPYHPFTFISQTHSHPCSFLLDNPMWHNAYLAGSLKVLDLNVKDLGEENISRVARTFPNVEYLCLGPAAVLNQGTSFILQIVTRFKRLKRLDFDIDVADYGLKVTHVKEEGDVTLSKITLSDSPKFMQLFYRLARQTLPACVAHTLLDEGPPKSLSIVLKLCQKNPHLIGQTVHLANALAQQVDVLRSWRTVESQLQGKNSTDLTVHYAV